MQKWTFVIYLFLKISKWYLFKLFSCCFSPIMLGSCSLQCPFLRLNHDTINLVLLGMTRQLKLSGFKFDWIIYIVFICVQLPFFTPFSLRCSIATLLFFCCFYAQVVMVPWLSISRPCFPFKNKNINKIIYK